jgi:3,4-dihydroxy 2-butanone 4-phosphate synthase / GTP cyclohydrolase II
MSLFSSVPELILALKKGEMIVLVDDENRENEGDIILAADFVNPEKINFIIKEARGLICLAMDSEVGHRLNLPMMVPSEQNSSPHRTAFTISIEAATGVSTGISAMDRAHTIWVASRPSSGPASVISPGHVFPIIAKIGGVLERQGHTEASVELMKLAGLNPCAVICEVLNDDGTMARVGDLKDFCKRHGFLLGSIDSIYQYCQMDTQREVECTL